MTNHKAPYLGVIICFVLICARAEAQDSVGVTRYEFGGVWVGKMIQPNGPRGEAGYSEFLHLWVHKYSVQGVARIEIPDTSFFAEMLFSGTIRDDSLFFREDSILSQKARDGYRWCLKEGVLVLDRDSMRLSGEWHSQVCAPGRIELRRIFEQ